MKAALFNEGILVVGGEPVKRYEPTQLPTVSISSTLVIGNSEFLVDGCHTFQAGDTPVFSTYELWEGNDQLLQLPELAGATHAPYAFRYHGDGGNPQENFSDGDTTAGLVMVCIIRKLSAENLAVAQAVIRPRWQSIRRSALQRCDVLHCIREAQVRCSIWNVTPVQIVNDKHVMYIVFFMPINAI